MSNIHFLSSGTKIKGLGRRISVSLFLFSGALTSTLFLSQHFFLSQFTQVDVGGQIRDAQDLKAYHAQLLSEVADAENKRNAVVLPIQNPLHQQLQYAKHTQADYWEFKERIETLVDRFTSESQKTVIIQSMRFLESEDRMELKGEVRHAGLRSMTVLAQFTETVRELPFVSTLPNPRFVRKQRGDGSSYSPFTLNIQL